MKEFPDECALLLVFPRRPELDLALKGLRGGDARLSLYAVESAGRALDYLRGRGDFAARHRRIVPLVVIIDAAPLPPEGRAMLQVMRRDARLKYMTVILLDDGRTSEPRGSAVHLHLAKPRTEAGYRQLAKQLERVLPVDH